MKRLAPGILVILLLAVSCSPTTQKHVPSEQDSGAATFNPLETPADREVVPEKYPPQADLKSQSLATHKAAKDGKKSDSTGTQMETYRVQLFMSRLIGEAGREKAVAEEIFTLPVYLDYEVPYYKIRIGDFATREEAESILPAVQGMGYNEAWVARVTPKVRELPPDNSLDQPLLPGDTLPKSGMTTDTASHIKGGYTQ
jgi:hypothetical protein